MMHKAGFVNIIGNPNVGKSTLMNALVGEHLSIITAKAQTTRHRILGIVNGENYQIVYSDLPGIIVPRYKLQEKMMRFIETALKDADVFLFIIQADDRRYLPEMAEFIKKRGVPVIVLINKIDLSTQEKVELQMKYWSGIFENSPVIPISALNNFNTEKVRDQIIELLPENPPFYPKDELTDKPLRFFISEIIREKILLNYKQEIPYSAEVVIERFKEGDRVIHIEASIYVTRESQKIIIIGDQAKAIKKLGIDARKDIEAYTGKQVYLILTAKVSKDWRDSELQLKRFGYE